LNAGEAANVYWRVVEGVIDEWSFGVLKHKRLLRDFR
jgi:hypothetical protein